MQHHAPSGYPTPPASPAYDAFKGGNNQQQQQAYSTSFQPRCVPLAPEQRLGRQLEGKLQLTEILGTGAYGVVYSAVDIKTGIRYAVKCLSKFNADGSPLETRQVAYQQREIRLHYLASTHPNVVSMLRIVDDTDCTYVVLEYCPEGDLFLNITELGQYVGKDELSRNIFLQIVDAVEHCHSLGIYHRDLKPENILVTDNGNTVKLADFGLATAEDRSEDYGCGSTFYMSPECLDASTRKPYYMCAPNDVWSLGVILVNLTCGRNPWKQASFHDSTYRAYTLSQDFLKTILPLTDELNDILARIFNPNPELRITLPELRCRIMACAQFTVPAPSQPQQPQKQQQRPVVESIPAYVASKDLDVDDYDVDDDYDCPPSPASASSDGGSLTSSGSTIDDLDDLEDDDDDDDDEDDDVFDDFDDQVIQEQQVVPSPPSFHHSAATACGAEDMAMAMADHGMFHGHGTTARPHGDCAAAVPVPIQQVQQVQQVQQSAAYQQQLPPVPVQVGAPANPAPVHAPVHAACQPKSFFPLWEVVRYVQQVPMMQHPVAIQSVPFIASFQGCY
ncbi:hypothetical protein E4U41_003604 [Claviceps citrina]|nr:hypothetical protein E4U41_003604 [Claviceps citrina]